MPCYVVAPSSTIDHAIAGGGEIPIEERAADEVARFGGRRVAPAGTAVSNPAFDVTPAANITAIVTEAGVHRAPFEQSLPARAPPEALPARSGTDTSQGPGLAWPHAVAHLARPPAASAPLRRLPRARRLDVRRVRSAAARARGAARAPAAVRRRRSPSRRVVPVRALRFLTTARSALWLDGPLVDVLARWKRGEIAPGRVLAALVAHELSRPAVDALAVVPAVRDRLLLRGADPPAELAAGLARWWGIPVVPLVARTRACARSAGSTPPRAGATSAARFAARAGPRSLALVDDVYTTGATVDECARALARPRAPRRCT